MTQQHDAVLAFYYMDSKNRVQVTEIFEVTPAESESIFPNKESKPDSESLKKKKKTCMEFLKNNHLAGMEEESGSEHSIEANNEEGIFSDPESEWKHSVDARPEAEQLRDRKNSYKVME